MGDWIRRMTSSALITWRGERAQRLDELVEAHTTVGGEGPGRRLRTAQLNLSLILRLAVEFQGFARDLHNVGAQQFAQWVVPQDARVQQIIFALLASHRNLDKGNATRERLSSDFNRFGLQWWPTLEAIDARSALRLDQLERVNRARNAIAHDLSRPIADLRQEGFALTFTTFKKWRGSLSALAATMDDALARHLAELFSKPRPW